MAIRLLYGLKTILSHMGCTRRTLRALMRAGLPVRVIGRRRGRRYVASEAAIETWFGSTTVHQAFILRPSKASAAKR